MLAIEAGWTHKVEPDEAAHSLNDVYRWHSWALGGVPYVWIAPKKVGGTLHCQSCQKQGQCVACADEQRRPLTAGTIPCCVVCMRLHSRGASSSYRGRVSVALLETVSAHARAGNCSFCFA